MPRRWDFAWDMALALLLAGLTLLGSGVWLADVTPEDGPWIGSWLSDAFDWQMGLGGGLIFLGLVCFGIRGVFGHNAAWDYAAPSLHVPEDERLKALAQRLFNPPYPPKPDWGQTLRGLGLFAALAAIVWYRAGAPAIGDFQLAWLRDGLNAYGPSIAILGATFVVWSVLTEGFARGHPFNTMLLELPLNGAWWLIRQCALVLGALVLALVTGLGVSAFGT